MMIFMHHLLVPILLLVVSTFVVEVMGEGVPCSVHTDNGLPDREASTVVTILFMLHGQIQGKIRRLNQRKWLQVERWI